MPGIDFNKLRTEIAMEQVLALLQFEPTSRTGDQWYGPCPLHDSTSVRSRSFSVNVATGRYCCHHCRSRGNQLELWATCTKLPLHQAAVDLCRLLARDVPWIRRW